MYRFLNFGLVYILGYCTHYMYENRSKTIFFLWSLLAFVILIMLYHDYMTVKHISDNIEERINNEEDK